MKRPFHLVLVGDEAFVFGGGDAAKAKELFAKKKKENADVHLFINPKPIKSWHRDTRLEEVSEKKKSPKK